MSGRPVKSHTFGVRLTIRSFLTLSLITFSFSLDSIWYFHLLEFFYNQSTIVCWNLLELRENLLTFPHAMVPHAILLGIQHKGLGEVPCHILMSRPGGVLVHQVADRESGDRLLRLNNNKNSKLVSLHCIQVLCLW